MMSVFSHVLEEVEGLTKKHPPVSFLVRPRRNMSHICPLSVSYELKAQNTSNRDRVLLFCSTQVVFAMLS